MSKQTPLFAGFNPVAERSFKGSLLDFVGVAWSAKRFLFREVTKTGDVYMVGMGLGRRMGSFRFSCPELQYPVAWNEETECLAVIRGRQLRVSRLAERRLEILGERSMPERAGFMTWIDDQRLAISDPPITVVDIGMMGARRVEVNPRTPTGPRPRLGLDTTCSVMAMATTAGRVNLVSEMDFRKQRWWGEWDTEETRYAHRPAFSSDGSKLCVAPRPHSPHDKKLRLRVGSVFTNGPLMKYPTSSPLNTVAFFPGLDGYVAPVHFRLPSMGLFDMKTGSAHREIPLKGYPIALSFAGDWEYLVAIYLGGVVIFEVSM